MMSASRSRSGRFGAVLAGLLAAAVVGCSGGGGGSDVEGTSGTLEGITAQLAAWSCADQAACCGQVGESFDTTTCEADTSARLLRRYEMSMREHGRGYDPEAGARCAQAIAGTPPQCSRPRNLIECSALLDGTKELGESCAVKTDCRGQAVGEVNCVAGVCAARKSPGETCSNCDDCNGRDLCRPVRDAVTGESSDQDYCFARRQDSFFDGFHDRGGAGDTCYRTCRTSPNRSGCAESSRSQVHDPATTVLSTCFANDGLQCGPSGFCEPLVPLGDACTSSIQCEGTSNCSDEGVCVPGQREGRVCDLRFDCAEGLTCGPDRRCRPSLGEGEDCGGDFGRQPCGENLVCARSGTDFRCMSYARSVCDSQRLVPSQSLKF